MTILFIGEGPINALLVYIVSGVYFFVSQVMKLFVVLSEVNTVDSDVYMPLVRNFYLVLGVGMLFVIAFSLLKAMVNPENTKGTEETTGIIKKLVTSILLLIFLPTIFNFAFSFQSAIISQGTIGKIFGSNVAFTEDTMKSAGSTMANSVFLPFFQPTQEYINNSCGGVNDNKCLESINPTYNFIFISIDDSTTNLYDTIERVNSGRDSFTSYAVYGGNIAEGELYFNFILALLCGIYLLYVVFSFCLDLGVRYVKLLFYQVVAPIPVFLRIVPNSKISDSFNQWVKVTLTCYLEVFIRMFVIYFGVWLISVLLNEDTGVFIHNFKGYNLLVNAIIVLGIGTFMKQVPKLIGETFGFDSSNMKLNIRQKLADAGLFQVAGAATTALNSANRIRRGFAAKGHLDKTDRLRRAFGMTAGALSGLRHGWKSNSETKTFSDLKKQTLSSVDKVMSEQDRRDLMYLRGGKEVIGPNGKKDIERNIFSGYQARYNVAKEEATEFWTGEEAGAAKLSKLFGDGIKRVSDFKSNNKSFISKLTKFGKDEAKNKYGETFADKFYGDENGFRGKTQDGKDLWGISRIEQEKKELEILNQAVNTLVNNSNSNDLSALEGVISQLETKGKGKKSKEFSIKLKAIQKGVDSGDISVTDAYAKLSTEIEDISKDLMEKQYSISFNEDQLEKELGEYIRTNFEKGTVDFKADTTDSMVALEEIRSFIRTNYGDVNYYYISEKEAKTRDDYVIEKDANGNDVYKVKFNFDDINSLSYSSLRKVKDTMAIEQGNAAKKAAAGRERESLMNDNK